MAGFLGVGRVIIRVSLVREGDNVFIGRDVKGLARRQLGFLHVQGVPPDDTQGAPAGLAVNDGGNPRGIQLVAFVVQAVQHAGQGIPHILAVGELVGHVVGLRPVGDHGFGADRAQTVVGNIRVLVDVVLKPRLGQDGHGFAEDFGFAVRE